MAIPAPVLDWLSQQLRHNYVDPHRTFADVTTVIAALPMLAPKTDVYTADSGHSELLLNLGGPLPTTIAGQTYGIPIEVWVPTQFPSAAPLIFVRPTPSMRIAPGSRVDGNGRCLFDWHPQNSLIATLSMFQEVFSAEPPVYARKAAQPSPHKAPKTKAKEYVPIKDIMNTPEGGASLRHGTISEDRLSRCYQSLCS